MAEVKDAPKVEERPLVLLVPNRRALAEQVRQTHVVTVESAEHPEDFLKPEFWSLVARDMRLGDHVEIRDDAMTYWGEFLVLACDSTWAKLHRLRESKLVPAAEREISPDFKVEHKGPHRKYCVIRLSDKSIIHEGEPDRSRANRWLEEYARTIGAKLAA